MKKVLKFSYIFIILAIICFFTSCDTYTYLIIVNKYHEPIISYGAIHGNPSMYEVNIPPGESYFIPDSVHGGSRIFVITNDNKASNYIDLLDLDTTGRNITITLNPDGILKITSNVKR